ncbi:hypothetical protein [Streptomyces noursei]|uniref:hypothetical protein n=1 Tax=Streptomyces noursei TaxID=1971 RepID=UPI0037FB5AAE
MTFIESRDGPERRAIATARMCDIDMPTGSGSVGDRTPSGPGAWRADPPGERSALRRLPREHLLEALRAARDGLPGIRMAGTAEPAVGHVWQLALSALLRSRVSCRPVPPAAGFHWAPRADGLIKDASA